MVDYVFLLLVLLDDSEVEYDEISSIEDNLVFSSVASYEASLIRFPVEYVQEPTRALAAKFDITLSRVDLVLRRVSQAVVDLSGRFIRWLKY